MRQGVDRAAALHPRPGRHDHRLGRRWSRPRRDRRPERRRAADRGRAGAGLGPPAPRATRWSLPHRGCEHRRHLYQPGPASRGPTSAWPTASSCLMAAEAQMAIDDRIVERRAALGRREVRSVLAVDRRRPHRAGLRLHLPDDECHRSVGFRRPDPHLRARLVLRPGRHRGSRPLRLPRRRRRRSPKRRWPCSPHPTARPARWICWLRPTR